MRIPGHLVQPMPDPVRVLWQNRSDSDSLPGGDTTVLKESVAALRSLGTDVDVSLEYAPQLGGYRLVHLNNISRTLDTLSQVRHARRNGRITLLTPLYEDMDRYLVKATKLDLLYQHLSASKTPLPLGKLAAVLAAFELPAHPLDNPVARHLGIGDKPAQAEILATADYVLTSGEAESRSILGAFGAVRNIETVRFGFNRRFLEADGRPFTEKYGLKDFVLCVGRLEARKNQWSLIEVFRGLPRLKLVLIGSFSNPAMAQAVKDYAPPNVIFLERLPFEELVSAFGAARVHALPSWYELPGLVSLEAAAAGCRIVSTSWGSAQDYFGNRVGYCEPDDPEGIRQAILAAYDQDYPHDLRAYVEANFGWEHTARKLREIYARAAAA